MAHLDVSPNRQALLQVAEAIEPLLRDVVFVGGQVAELLVTAPAATRVRPTDDIDVVVGATTVVEYRKIELRLEELGLRNDFDGPICRWRTNEGHKVDLMPHERDSKGLEVHRPHDAQFSDDLEGLSASSTTCFSRPSLERSLPR